MPNFWCRLSNQIRDKINNRRNRRRHKQASRNPIDGNESENDNDNDVNKFSLPKYNEPNRPRLSSLFPDIEIGHEKEKQRTSNNPRRNSKQHEQKNGKMIAYVPRVTQEMCMSQILFGTKFEDCLERCRSDFDLRTFGAYDEKPVSGKSKDKFNGNYPNANDGKSPTFSQNNYSQPNGKYPDFNAGNLPKYSQNSHLQANGKYPDFNDGNLPKYLQNNHPQPNGKYQDFTDGNSPSCLHRKPPQYNGNYLDFTDGDSPSFAQRKFPKMDKENFNSNAINVEKWKKTPDPMEEFIKEQGDIGTEDVLYRSKSSDHISGMFGGEDEILY